MDFENILDASDSQRPSCNDEAIILTSSEDEEIPIKKRRAQTLSNDAKELIISCYDTLISENHNNHQCLELLTY